MGKIIISNNYPEQARPTPLQVAPKFLNKHLGVKKMCYMKMVIYVSYDHTYIQIDVLNQVETL